MQGLKKESRELNGRIKRETRELRTEHNNTVDITITTINKNIHLYSCIVLCLYLFIYHIIPIHILIKESVNIILFLAHNYGSSIARVLRLWNPKTSGSCVR